MKYLCTILFLVPLANLAQQVVPQPMPCEIITPANISNYGNSISSYSCINAAGDGQNDLNINASVNKEMKAGQTIAFAAETHISASGTGTFHAYIEESPMEVVWFYPNSTPGSVGQFEKLELGIRLPADIEDKIDNYLAEPPLHNNLNPFDPEDVDIIAEFYSKDQSGTWQPANPGFGFFYVEFERESDLTGWADLQTPYRFRIRYTPRTLGEWKCRIVAAINAYGSITSEFFPFTVVPSSDPHASDFVRVGENNRFFKIGDEPFFPVGQNLAWPFCYMTDNGTPDNTSDDWDPFNCGESYDKAHSGELMDVKGYQMYEWEMNQLAVAGANYFRMIIVPMSTEIEFEKLNNYSDRMHCAWEVDRILENAREFDLRIHFDMQVHYAFERPSVYKFIAWDWLSADDVCPGSNPDYGCYPEDWATAFSLGEGYAYRDVCPDPLDFFDLSNGDAIVPYKNRLRYMVARYGYSTNIATFELLSEINKTFDKYKYPADPNGPFGDIEGLPSYNDQDFQTLVYNWQHEMLDYLKGNLGANQILSVSYNAQPTGITGGPDHSYGIESLDLPTWNNYSTLNYKFSDLISVVYDIQNQYNKPLMNSEAGWNPDVSACDQACDWIREVWLSSFSGLAGTAMPWSNQHNYELWEHLGRIQQFTGGIDFDGGTGDPWIPFTGISTDGLVEMTCLYEPNELRYTGVVANRTYNVYNQGCDDQSGSFEPYLKSGQDVESALILGLWGLVGHEYTFKWYNAMTGDLLQNSTIQVESGILPIWTPLLTADNTCPIMVFRASESNLGSFLPEKSQVNATQSDSSLYVQNCSRFTAKYFCAIFTLKTLLTITMSILTQVGGCTVWTLRNRYCNRLR